MEIDFVLPAGLNDESGTKLVCRGEIVRLEPPPETGSPWALAAKILGYHLIDREGAQ